MGPPSAAAAPRPRLAAPPPLLLLLALAALAGAAADGGAPAPAEPPACDDLLRAPPAERCAFARKHCPGEGLVGWLPFYYCHLAPWGVAVAAPFALLTAALLAVLFRAVGRTADGFLAPALAQLSQDAGLPPRLAGVTLLALGNGAPDLSAAVAAVRSGNARMALGSLTGGALFVTCVVGGRIVAAAGGVRARAAQVRDVLALAVAIVAVLAVVLTGRVTHATIAALLALYAAYAAAVAVADVTKRRCGVEWADVGRAALARATRGRLGGGAAALAAPLLARASGGSAGAAASSADGATQVGGGMRAPPTVTRAATLPDAGLELRALERGPAPRRARTAPGPARDLAYAELLALPAAEYRRRALEEMAISEGEEGEGGEEAEALLDALEPSDLEAAPPAYEPPPVASPPAARAPPLPPPPAVAVVSPPAAAAPPAPPARAEAAVRLLDAGCAPIMLLLKATVPIVEPSLYERGWFLRATALSPLFVCVYLGALRPAPLAFAAAAGAAAAAAAAAGTARLGGAAPAWRCGARAPLGAGAAALWGFAVAALWVDVLASEIVGLLHAAGLLAHVPPAVLGVTVLAWGNSLTDLVANSAMAVRSHAGTSMAMTACFAGPLFNLLVGLGAGFWAFLADSGARSAPIAADPVVLAGCAFGLAGCAGVAAAAVAAGGRLPAAMGWAMLGWYAAYMAVVLMVVVF